MDYFSEYDWAWVMAGERQATVAYVFASLLADILPVKYVQCDQTRTGCASIDVFLSSLCCTSARTEWTFRNEDADGAVHTTGGTCHFEAMVKRVWTDDGVAEYTIGAHTATEYNLTLTLAGDGVVSSKAASEQMAVYYALESKVHQFQLLDAVACAYLARTHEQAIHPAVCPVLCSR